MACSASVARLDSSRRRSPPASTRATRAGSSVRSRSPSSGATARRRRSAAIRGPIVWLGLTVEPRRPRRAHRGTCPRPVRRRPDRGGTRPARPLRPRPAGLLGDRLPRGLGGPRRRADPRRRDRPRRPAQRRVRQAPADVVPLRARHHLARRHRGPPDRDRAQPDPPIHRHMTEKERHMRELYPEIEPYESGMLDVGDGQLIHWELVGNPTASRRSSCTADPAVAASPTHRRFFDPDAYRVLLFDQRGCGQSTPNAGEYGATCRPTPPGTSSRTSSGCASMIGVDRWLVFGGSWGSTLALAYAETHPERVSELILRGIFFSDATERRLGLQAAVRRTCSRTAGRTSSRRSPPTSVMTCSLPTIAGSTTRIPRCGARRPWPGASGKPRRSI